MKIAQVAPLMEAVPPKLYGGTERIVSYLTDQLVELGHNVTLFASGDSVTNATLEPVWPCALRLYGAMRDYLAPHIVMIEQLARRADEFDIIHLHLDYLGYPILRRAATPFLATLHGRLDLPELARLYETFDDVPVVSISNSQREPLPQAHYVATVLHGIPARLLLPGFGAGGYLAFLGRISPEKRPDRAIRIALKAGMTLKIAAKVDAVDREYFESTIKPLLSEPGIEFLAEINESQKVNFLGNAYAYLFPIDWPEPFGLAMIEAMACGTPVVAFRCGSVPELIEDGVTGFIVKSEEEAVKALPHVASINRAKCRATFERRFTATRMAKDYLSIYHSLVEDLPRVQAIPTLELPNTLMS